MIELRSTSRVHELLGAKVTYINKFADVTRRSNLMYEFGLRNLKDVSS